MTAIMVERHVYDPYVDLSRGGAMKRIVVAWCALVFLFFGAQVCRSEELTAAKKADIERLFKLTGVLKMADMVANQLAQQTISAIQATHPDVPARVFDVVREETGKVLGEALSESGGLMDLMAELYHRHLSRKEIKGLIAFYETSLGRKMIEISPTLFQEGMSLGKAWGQRLGPIIDERVKNRLRGEDIDI